MDIIDQKPFTLAAPFGQLPLLLDKERRSDPEHVREVALEILRRAGTRHIDGAFELDLNVWRGLLNEQLAYASGHNPFLRGSTEYLTAWEYVLHGLLDTHIVELDLGSMSVCFAEVALTA